ncbi:hypothetical protein [Vreelandella populi]|uniref:Uncharacterized protein n=1 Tax=Vreelandella populi TaxID=2498858 RepID=A0A3S0WHI4_9GAMM|nr:hypothetical protein [Halomonas populi]RUR43381.1 hypothetical protein ELY37_16825 [Halomonas populi]
MATAPTVPDFTKWNFALNDTTDIIVKDNGRNAALERFGNSLKAMTDSINDDLETMEGQKTATHQAAQAGSESAQQAARDKQTVAQDRAHVDQQKQAIDTTAGQVNSNAQQVADDRAAVAQNTQTSTQAAQDAGAAAGASIQAKDDAQALYGDLSAVDAAKTQAQQAATTAGEERAQAETARSGAETAQQAAETAAGESQSAASAAVQAHVEEEDPHTQYAKRDALKAAAYRDVVGPADKPVMAQGAFGWGDTLPLWPNASVLDTTGVESGGYRYGNLEDRPSSAYGCLIYLREAGGETITAYSAAYSNRPVPDVHTIRKTSSTGLWSGWSRGYGTHNILGAVSQLDGVPTGAIIERGSNSDGSYTVFAGGAFLAQRVVPTIAVNNTEVVYPLPVDAEVGSVSMSLSCRVNLNTTARRDTVRDHIVGGAISWSLALRQSTQYTPASNIDLALFAYGQRREKI